MSIFDFIDPKEERHERIAQMAANLCRREHYDPTEALRKVANDNALNSAETEDVCAKLNHTLFKEKFAEDKLAVFNAAQYNKVTGDLSEMGKTASVDYQSTVIADLEKRAEEIAAMPTEDSTDPIMQEAADKYRNHEFSRFLEQTATNASEISAHHMAIDNIVGEMKERIFALYKEGVPLEEIYDTILMSAGESQAPSVQQYFLQVVQELQSEGLIPPEKKVQFDDPEKLAADFSVSPRLTTLVKELKENTNKAILKEACHEAALDIIYAAGRYDLAEKLDKNVDALRMTDTIEKNAGINVGKTFSDMKDAAVPQLAKDKLLGGVALALGMAAVSGGAMAAEQGFRGAKRQLLKRKLPQMFPELQEIPKEQYGHLYDTITVLDPQLIRAPYAVAEMIKRYASYGTIDTGNILQLQGAHKPGVGFSDFAVAPARDTLSNVASSFYKYDTKRDGVTTDADGNIRLTT